MTFYMALDLELETYHRELPKLIADSNEGKFVLVRGEAVIDVFGTYEDAIKEGYTRFGLESFLVKQILEGYTRFGLESFLVKHIQAVEQVHLISRLLLCPTSPGR